MKYKKVFVAIVQKDFLKNNMVNMVVRTGPVNEKDFKIE